MLTQLLLVGHFVGYGKICAEFFAVKYTFGRADVKFLIVFNPNHDFLILQLFCVLREELYRICFYEESSLKS